MNKNLKIGIIGMGAIGSYIASKFKLSDLSPTVFIKEKNNGILKILFRENGRIHNHQFNIGDRRITTSFDFLFVAVKSYNLQTIIKSYQNLINASKRIILIQSNINIKNLEWNSNIDKIYVAPVLIGVLGDYRSIIYELNKGSILFGKLNDKNDESNLVNKLLNFISPTTRSLNIEYDLFMKVIINTSLFPISIINSCNFGLAYKDENNINFASKIFYESLLVAKVHFKLNKIKFYDCDYNNISFENSIKVIKKLTKKYQNIFPSILIDIIKDKENNELSFFYDDIIKLANEYNIDIPNLNLAYEMIKCFVTKKFFLNSTNIKEIKKYYRQHCV